MRFRRRRKPRVQWLKMPGTELNQGFGPLVNISENPSAIEIAFGTLAAGTANGPVSFDAPLVVDNPVDETFQGSSLTVYQNFALNQLNEFGYRLRRIVGDIFVGVQRQSTQSQNEPGLLLQCGIMVRRVNTDGSAAVSAAESIPGTIGNETDPWVWRRNYALSSTFRGNTDSVRDAIGAFPNSTIAYGTKHHIAIDQKTARRIGPEERLFLNVTAWELPLNIPGTGATASDDHLTVYFLMPYRVLGTVITAAGNRRNASR